MIEAELKARLTDPAAVRSHLEVAAPGESTTYHDVYFDRPDGSLNTAGQELRVRTISTASGSRVLVTFKDAAVDPSGSKPEHETTVGDAGQAAAILRGLGFQPSIALTKECVNYRLQSEGRNFLATLVRVPELDDAFLEVETLVEPDDVAAALAAVRDVLAELGVDEAELTSELYTDAVRANRGTS